jgi:hypothetical protein
MNWNEMSSTEKLEVVAGFELPHLKRSDEFNFTIRDIVWINDQLAKGRTTKDIASDFGLTQGKVSNCNRSWSRWYRDSMSMVEHDKLLEGYKVKCFKWKTDMKGYPKPEPKKDTGEYITRHIGSRACLPLSKWVAA